jgi:hypothetical protein
MNKTMLYTLMVLLAAGMTAEAKKDKGTELKGKPDKALQQAEDTGKAQAKAAEKELEATEEKAADTAEKARKKGKGKKKKGKRDAEEMKEAVAQKKEAQKAAKESGEKMDKEEKSWWKFWKK